MFFKTKIQIFLEKYVITPYNIFSRILGVVLYTCYCKSFFKKGFNNSYIKRRDKTWYITC